jgi:hypothetical protein
MAKEDASCMSIRSIEIYKAFILTVIAILLLVMASRERHVTVDGGEVEVTNTVDVKADDPLDVHAVEPLDVNIADQADVIYVAIEK